MFNRRTRDVPRTSNNLVPEKSRNYDVRTFRGPSGNVCGTSGAGWVAPFRILYLLIESFVDLFVDISSIFADSSPSLFSKKKYLFYLKLFLLLIFFSLISKSVFLENW